MFINKRQFLPIAQCTAALLFLLSHGMHGSGVPLANKTLAMLDGVYSAFDGETVRGSLVVRSQVGDIYLGKADASGKRVGFYTVGDKKNLSLQEVAAIEEGYRKAYEQELAAIDERFVDMATCRPLIEAERARMMGENEHMLSNQVMSIEKKYTDPDLRMTECWKAERLLALAAEKALEEFGANLKKKHCKDIAGYEQAKRDAHQRFEATMAPILSVLEKIREDFIAVNAPFMDQTMGTKALLLQLIEEFCCKHNLQKSFLLEWASVPDGLEIPFFDKSMTTNCILAEFCADLRLFLGDLVTSCPKGMAQFKKLTAK